MATNYEMRIAELEQEVQRLRWELQVAEQAGTALAMTRHMLENAIEHTGYFSVHFLDDIRGGVFHSLNYNRYVQSVINEWARMAVNFRNNANEAEETEESETEAPDSDDAMSEDDE